MLEDFFKIVANLKNIPRQGWKNKLEIEFPESVADHCFSLTTMGMVLADLENLDTEKVLKMSLLHDLSESITGDFTPDKISKSKKETLENNIIKKILANLPKKLSDQYHAIWVEYQQKQTDESVFVHELDKLEMALQAIIYSKDSYPKEKIQTFLDTANNEIKNEKLRKILAKLLQ